MDGFWKWLFGAKARIFVISFLGVVSLVALSTSSARSRRPNWEDRENNGDSSSGTPSGGSPCRTRYAVAPGVIGFCGNHGNGSSGTTTGSSSSGTSTGGSSGTSSGTTTGSSSSGASTGGSSGTSV